MHSNFMPQVDSADSAAKDRLQLVIPDAYNGGGGHPGARKAP
jgi:hypothetical protein